MNIVMLSPGYPAEMAHFTRALAAVGARVVGVGDQPPHALPPEIVAGMPQGIKDMMSARGTGVMINTDKEFLKKNVRKRKGERKLQFKAFYLF